VVIRDIVKEELATAITPLKETLNTLLGRISAGIQTPTAPQSRGAVGVPKPPGASTPKGRGGPGRGQLPRVLPKEVVPLTAHEPEGSEMTHGSGSTRRAALRKARLAIRKTYDNAEDHCYGDISKLARLKIRWEISSDEALGSLKEDFPDIILPFKDALQDPDEYARWDFEERPSKV
jgi:hypothetical protein